MTIKLRVLEEDDLLQLRDWRNDDRLRCSCREYRLLNMINQRDWFDYISRSPKVEMFGIEHEGTLVGVCGLCNIDWVNRNAEVSIYTQEADVAAEALDLLEGKAFEEFNLHRLWVEVYSSHAEKIALLEEGGYTLEGKMRQHVFKQGRYYGSLIYGLLRGETC